MREFRVGDRVICLLSGEGVVTSISNTGTYPIEVNFTPIITNCYTRDGNEDLNDRNRMLYHEAENPRIVVDEIKEPVEVTVERWINVYSGGNTTMYRTKCDAERFLIEGGKTIHIKENVRFE